MPATIVDIADTSAPLPEFIFLDANVVLALRATSVAATQSRNHQLATAFLTRLQTEAQAGKVKPLLPLLALEECYFKLCSWALESLAPTSGLKANQWHQLYKTSPNLLSSATPILRAFYRNLQAFPIEITEPEDAAILPKGRAPALADRILDYIDRFLILPKDATILSEADRLGIYAIATLDRDWRRADGFTIWTSP